MHSFYGVGHCECKGRLRLLLKVTGVHWSHTGFRSFEERNGGQLKDSLLQLNRSSGGFDRRGSRVEVVEVDWLPRPLGFSTGSPTAQESPQFPAHWMVDHPSRGGSLCVCAYCVVGVRFQE